MSHSVTVELSQNVIARARIVAVRTNRSVEHVLAEWLDRYVSEMPVEALSDAEVLALSETQMDPSQQRELSGLLERNREGALSDTGDVRLDELLLVYRRGLARKAQALRIVAQRGLR